MSTANLILNIIILVALGFILFQAIKIQKLDRKIRKMQIEEMEKILGALNPEDVESLLKPY